ncbi:MAG: YggS family pyridoxal phosphate-dependent enzyme [Dethiobacter sp.]|nr:YggS family pyridoxal phosphate-dependent enzyme [Dethiobacter sp.]
MTTAKRLAENIAAVQSRLQSASLRAGGREIKLVAVTKTVPTATIAEALSLGLHAFGENRVQEALNKIDTLPQAQWHFIGRLQTNKARDVVGRFSLIHSLDRWKLAVAMQEQADKKDVAVNVLVQVNIAGEQQKGGLEPSELHDFLQAVSGLSRLSVQGLMTVPPIAADPEEARPYFRRMYQLYCQCDVPGVSMKYLSMGMSGDYEVAVEEGSNLVRIGSAIFSD